MRIFLRGLTMMAVLLSTSASFAADPQNHTYVGDSEAEYFGEESANADDSSGLLSEEDGGVYQASSSAHIGDEPIAPVEMPGVRAAALHSPTTATYQPAGLRKLHTLSAPSYSEPSCNGGCGGSCGGGCSTRSQMTKMMSGKCPDMWIQAETLLWFPQARSAPPLAVVAPAGELPFLTTPGITTIGEEFGNNLSPGFRGDIGRYFGNGNFGIGGRFWILAEDDDNYNLSDDGTNFSIGVPFLDTSGFGENAAIIALQDGNVPGFLGSVSGESSLDMIAAEVYGRLNLGRGKEFHTDLIGGYSYFGIDDHLNLNASLTQLPGNGGTTTFRDTFDTTNEFHGGQIGAETILRRGRWVARSLTKVHLGNMSQTVDISGNATTQASNISPVVNFGDGLFAGGTNGTFDQDVFTFAPEMNLKLGYRFRDRVTFTVGYSFLYWNNVALSGEQIDRNLEFDLNGVQDRQTDFAIQDKGFFVQGIDLGTTIEF